MNKSRYRLVFNAKRGQRMAVAETAHARGGAGEPACEPPPRAVTLGVLTVALALIAFGTLVLCAPARAQIRADASAPGSQRPTLLRTANGVTQVNIQTPSAAGVSRNVYSQFDVGAGGAILNNSGANVATRLAGMITGNPWIGAAPARVILNEVNSSNPSYLRGPLEVAGQRAEVVIANPSGIQVNGGAFINASGVTLTTGAPVTNSGNLESFRVQRGSVNIEGLGLDTRTADATRILARAVQLNAELWAQQVTVVGGANQVQALASGAAASATPIAGATPAPSFMLDVAALGGMYAGKIFLRGTEAGLGVNNRGTLASQGELVLLANGQLVNSGKIHAQGNTSVAITDELTQSDGGLIAARGNTDISARGMRIDGTAIVAAGLAADGTRGGDGTLSVTTREHAAIQGTVFAAGKLSVQAASLDASDMKAAAADVELVATAGAVDLTGAGMTTAGVLSAHAAGSLTTDSARLQGGRIELAAASISNRGGELSQSGGGTFLLASSGRFDNTDGVVTSAGALSVTAASVANARGDIQADGNASIDAAGGALDNTAGRLTANGALTLTTGSLLNGIDAGRGGLIGSQGALTMATLLAPTPN